MKTSNGCDSQRVKLMHTYTSRRAHPAMMGVHRDLSPHSECGHGNVEYICSYVDRENCHIISLHSGSSSPICYIKGSD